MWILPGRGVETRDGEQVAGQDHGVGAPWLPTSEREREGETEEGQLQYPRTELGWQLGFAGWGARERRRKGWQLGFALLPRGSGQ